MVRSSELVVASWSFAELGTAQPQLVYVVFIDQILLRPTEVEFGLQIRSGQKLCHSFQRILVFCTVLDKNNMIKDKY